MVENDTRRLLGVVTILYLSCFPLVANNTIVCARFVVSGDRWLEVVWYACAFVSGRASENSSRSSDWFIHTQINQTAMAVQRGKAIIQFKRTPKLFGSAELEKIVVHEMCGAKYGENNV